MAHGSSIGNIRGRKRIPMTGVYSCLSPCDGCKNPAGVMMWVAENIQACLRIFRRAQHQWLVRDILQLPQGVFIVFVLLLDRGSRSSRGSKGSNSSYPSNPWWDRNFQRMGLPTAGRVSQGNTGGCKKWRWHRYLSGRLSNGDCPSREQSDLRHQQTFHL